MKIQDKNQVTTLRQLIRRADLTREEIAQRTGLSVNAIDRYLAGNRMPGFDKAVLLASALGVSLKTLAISLGIDVSDVPNDTD